jgi:hypothetical protein
MVNRPALGVGNQDTAAGTAPTVAHKYMLLVTSVTPLDTSERTVPILPLLVPFALVSTSRFPVASSNHNEWNLPLRQRPSSEISLHYNHNLYPNRQLRLLNTATSASVLFPLPRRRTLTLRLMVGLSPQLSIV